MAAVRYLLLVMHTDAHSRAQTSPAHFFILTVYAYSALLFVQGESLYSGYILFLKLLKNNIMAVRLLFFCVVLMPVFAKA